jgi:hypothetical protein
MRNDLSRSIAAVALGTAAIAVGVAHATPAARNALPARLVGSWTKAMSLKTWHGNGVYDELPGRWSIVITREGETKIIEPPGHLTDEPLTTMPATAVSRMVHFGATADRFCQKASYTWTASSHSVIFKAVSDPCLERRVLMTAGPWTRL